MKYNAAIIFLFVLFCSNFVFGQNDSLITSSSINIQQISWFAIGKYHLLTTANYHHSFKDDISVYDNIVRGDFNFIFNNKGVEYFKAQNFILKRNRPIVNPITKQDSVIVLNEIPIYIE